YRSWCGDGNGRTAHLARHSHHLLLLGAPPRLGRELAVSVFRFNVAPKLRSPRFIAQRLVLCLIVLVACLLFIFPLYWMVFSSMIPRDEAFRFPPYFVPSFLRFDA